MPKLMVTSDKIRFNCLEVKQPVGFFYIGVMNRLDLVHISWADIRRLYSGDEMREVEVYTGIQRKLSDQRVKELTKYVRLIDATFPSSIILHVDQEDAFFDIETSTLELPRSSQVAKVLDGQHRIAGLATLKDAPIQFDSIVTIFVGMELEDQALVFATINQTQTKVNKSLVSDLFAFATHRSPQRTCHIVVRALDQKDNSPFKEKIKILGTANDREKETITQSTFSESLIKLISKDPMSDRDKYKRGAKPERYRGNDLLKHPLRDLFIDEEDGKIATVIWEYFAAVRKRWPRAWDDVQPEMILNKSTGFIALMRLFQPLYVSFDRIGEIVDRGEYLSLFQKVELKDSDFNRREFIPGSGGQSELYKRLYEQLF